LQCVAVYCCVVQFVEVLCIAEDVNKSVAVWLVAVQAVCVCV